MEAAPNPRPDDPVAAAAPIEAPPKGLALAALLGPSIVWCAEYIGSGEVILATRTGAVLGIGILWAVVLGVALKYFIGLAGGWYTVATGESMIDLFGRLPGPKNAVVWLVFVLQLLASVLAIGSIAVSVGVFIAEITPLRADVGGWIATLIAVSIAWLGEFKPLKIVMAVLISLTLAGVAAIALRVVPSVGDLLASLVPRVPAVPEWAAEAGVSTNAWSEVLPLLAWGAGGFASQVWYTYWIMGAGYGASAGGRQGKPADLERLQRLTDADVTRLGGWRRMVTFDATLALVVGTVVTCGFLIAGAGVLGAKQIVPEGNQVALRLAEVFRNDWGATGATLFLVGGAAALLSTQIAQVTGWPYLMDDCARLCLPSKSPAKWPPLKRRRAWIAFYLVSTVTVVAASDSQAVELVRTAAVVEGLLLTPVQALAMLIGLYWVMPRLFTPEVAQRLRPGPWIGVGLVVSFVVFTYFCVVQAPKLLF